MLDRTQSPPSNTISAINFIRPVKHNLDNGVPVYILNAPKQSLVRIEFIVGNINFDPGNPLKTIAISALLKSGTKTKTAREIAEAVDHYGAFLDGEFGPDCITVTLYSLNKHLKNVLPILHDVLTSSIFPAKELSIYQTNQKQKYQVNMQKNDFVARKKFSHTLYGNTPYGAEITEESYDRLSQNDLAEYYAMAFVPENYTIIASGKFEKEEWTLLNELFGTAPIKAPVESNSVFDFPGKKNRQILIERPDAIQSAIRIGTRSINRAHPDFPGLSVLVTILGGYFGSRLMTNIREDKGYTYGIGAALMSLKHTGQLFIATEVGTDVCEAALKEIYKEIDLLRNEAVEDAELELVRSYMLGALLGSLENIFSHADKFKNLLFSGLDYSYYERYIHTVKTITAPALQSLAVKYFTIENFTELVVGKR